MKVYKCFKSDFPELEKKIKRITKKLDKNNLKWFFEVLGESIEEVTVWDYVNRNNIPAWQFSPKNCGKIIVDVISYTFEMESLKLGEFEVLAVIEHNAIEKTNENIIHVIKENASIPIEYRTVKSHCEHCNSDRKRNKTVLLINPEGQIKQVGSTCIKEYTGIDGLNIIGNYQDIHDILIEECYMDYEKQGSYSKYDKTLDYLASCIQIIDTTGYVKSNEYNSTKYKAWEICGTDKQDEKYIPIAEKVIDYFQSREFKAYETFLDNIKLYLSNEYIKVNGIVAYAYVAYQKEIEKEEKKLAEQLNKKPSNFVGDIGKRLEIELTYKKHFSYETKWGITKIYLFEDAQGNIYKWSTTNYIEKEEGENLKLKGTIKAHDEYNGEKQTVLTRCKVIK